MHVYQISNYSHLNFCHIIIVQLDVQLLKKLNYSYPNFYFKLIHSTFDIKIEYIYQ